MAFAGLTRDEVSALLAMRCFPEIAQVHLRVVEDSADIQLFSEQFQGLTAARLDLLHRLLRLARGIGASFAELDLLLLALKAAGAITTLDSVDASGRPRFLALAPLLALAARLGLDREAAAALAGPLPETGLRAGQNGLIDRVFDRRALFGVVGQNADGSPRYAPTATLKADRTADTVAAPLAAGLGVSGAELSGLLTLLGKDLTTDIVLDAEALVRLWRLSHVMRGLNRTAEELAALARVVTGGAAPVSVAHMQAVIDWHDRLCAADIAPAEAVLVLTGTEHDTHRFAATPATAAALVAQLQTETAADKTGLLAAALAETHGVSVSEVQHSYLGKLTTATLADAAMATALAAPLTNGQPDTSADLLPLLALMRELERARRMVSAFALSPIAVAALGDAPGLWGIADPAALGVTDWHALSDYAALARLAREREPELLAALAGYDGATFESGAITLMAELANLPAPVLRSVQEAMVLPAAPVAALSHLVAAARAADRLGVNGGALVQIATAQPSQSAADILRGAAQARYRGTARATEALSALEARVNELRRDAICAFIIGHYDRFKFRDRGDLYAFFLLDPEMSGCFTTSRVIAAVSSLQTYITRCLLNLEQSDPLLNPALPNLRVDPTWLPAEEWDWSKNYRVWEANRKVFLYPENYIDPALRDDKTHLFKALEDELMQQEVSLASAEEAYKRYLAGFADLAALRYAGALAQAPAPLWAEIAAHLPKALTATQQNAAKTASVIKMTGASMPVQAYDSDWTEGAFPRFHLSEAADPRTYYLFAHTGRAPNRYFYRSYRPDGDVWGNWQPMEVPIEAARVSPILHHGRLYLFWNDIKYKELNNFSGGDSVPGGVRFEVKTHYATRNEDGSWSTVQKMPLGAMTLPRDEVYQRVLGRYPLDDEERDAIKEDVFQQFCRDVFGKPYAALGQTDAEPMQLHYIWSQEEGVQEVIYRTGALNVTSGPIHISSSGASFRVLNNQFGGSTPIALEISAFGLSFSLVAQARIIGPTACVVETDVLSLRLGLSAETQPTTIYSTRSGLSLARGELTDARVTQLDRRASYRALTAGTRAFLKPEYDLCRVGSITSFFVETGHTSFTEAPRTISQQPWGAATLSLPADLGGVTAVPLSTVLTEELTETLHARGLEAFLDLPTQTLRNDQGQRLDFRGPYGLYYWEMFFHIPFLIARHCNATGKFREARWWYERIFNPTSPESPADVKPSDHNWRFCQFREASLPKLRDILTDTRAIAAYKTDPFDPHAIAALRRSAYMKAVVMAYVDNLVDWADALFARDTRESVNEALMLYRFARDVLGDKPVEAGECKTAESLTYEKIASSGRAGSEFLVLLENVLINQRNGQEYSRKPLMQDLLNRAEFAAFPHEGVAAVSLEMIEARAGAARLSDRFVEARLRMKTDTTTRVRLGDGTEMTAAEAVARDKLTVAPRYGMAATRSSIHALPGAEIAVRAKKQTHLPSEIAERLKIDRVTLADRVRVKPARTLPGPVVARTVSAAFCVPRNEDLLACWTRIDLQLFKIRNCQNISGQRRRLALTDPPIDPMMLVRARAAGLSLEDLAALAVGAGQSPRHRFRVLLQQARQAAQLTRDFGSALLLALEKKDAEELSRLQITHERNLQSLSRALRERRLSEAGRAYESAALQQQRAEARVAQLDALISGGLNPWEVLEQVSTHAATGLKIAESVVHLMAGITYLVPQVGSPFSMKYGGKELGDSGVEFALWTSAMAGVFTQLASSARLEASNQRREQGWRDERELARIDARERAVQSAMAEIRVAIAERELEIFDRERAQTEERERFFKDKFTGLGLYTHLAGSLGRLYRRAFALALETAREAERAYQFETDQTDSFIAADSWDAAHGGLLAGERLTLQLLELEQAHLRAGTRREEIRQAFSLAMLDPTELVNLRQTGACTLRLPEIAFETIYPGQYRRLIRSVRVSIPSVTGPRTNIGARLTLVRGDVRPEPGAALQERLAGKNEAISLSRGIDDSGSFEQSPNGERYLPFEGAGAVSEWRLELPASVRSFDYASIADVILDLDYTALQGDRAAADAALGAAITAHAATQGLYRMISLRHEMPDVWARLTMQPPATPGDIPLTLGDQHFPYLMQGRTLTAETLKLLLRPAPGQSVAPPPLAVDGVAVAWKAALYIALPGAAGEAGKLKGAELTVAGNPRKTWVLAGAEGALHGLAVGDLLLVLRYKASM
ncbi:neuraminidase-like domain-containing protein [Rhodobacter lacus]|uniref:Neuraminidase-like domain-containing protein n=1 Tax=Rhodobacter lacus TaxID=1641972 RepID=A0ABW5ACC9_9RHOB